MPHCCLELMLTCNGYSGKLSCTLGWSQILPWLKQVHLYYITTIVMHSGSKHCYHFYFYYTQNINNKLMSLLLISCIQTGNSILHLQFIVTVLLTIGIIGKGSKRPKANACTLSIHQWVISTNSMMHNNLRNITKIELSEGQTQKTQCGGDSNWSWGMSSNLKLCHLSSFEKEMII